jgi:hypothetical protein
VGVQRLCKNDDKLLNSSESNEPRWTRTKVVLHLDFFLTPVYFLSNIVVCGARG